MAIDEVLLDSAAEHGLTTLRFYQWSIPTLSLGYFQSAFDRERHAPSLACPVVRRSSGGGAIVHDQELTYSLALPASHRLSADADRLYRAIHTILQGILNASLTSSPGPQVVSCGPTTPLGEEPFLCFRRRGAGDLLLASKSQPDVAQKIAGSAQRRRQGAVLQHGSLLLAASSYAPELMGFAELAGVPLDLHPLISELTSQVEKVLDLGVKPQPLSAREASFAAELSAERFASPDWTNRR